MPEVELRLDPVGVAGLLRSEASRVGVFERVVGLNTATTAIKSVHLMNDLAQQVVGGAPSHKGDYLCRLIRFDRTGDEESGEDNADETLRHDPEYGHAYEQAFPASLGSAATLSIRDGARLLLNRDGGMYKAGDNMASGLASHWTLLGFDGFSRFGLGAALSAMLGEAGRAKVKALFESASDPVSRALRPVMLTGELIERRSGRGDLDLTAFDQQFGERILNMLSQGLSKPTTLRMLALAGVAWTVLRILGVGREEGRPVVLAIPSRWRALGSRLREPAVQCLALGVAELDAALARELGDDEEFRKALTAPTYTDDGGLVVSEEYPARDALAELRCSKRERVYWPDAFATALGKRVGCVGPSSDRAGWGKYFCLTPDLLEALALMYVNPSGKPRTWRSLWAEVREELGVTIGANPYEDEEFLRKGGLRRVSLDDLQANSVIFLNQACSRGVARHLPDGEAEVGTRIL